MITPFVLFQPGQQVKGVRRCWNLGIKKEGINPLSFRIGGVKKPILYNSGLLLLFH